jgi:hypothetical protein
MRLTSFRGDDFIRRVPFILTAYGKALDGALRDEIKSVRYGWPGPTLRQNGEIAGTIRDIVDTGAFLRSQRRRRINVTTIRFEWGGSGGVTYAGFIFQGIEKRNYPPRDWIKPALEAQPIGEFFRREWARLAAAGL